MQGWDGWKEWEEAHGKRAFLRGGGTPVSGLVCAVVRREAKQPPSPLLFLLHAVHEGVHGLHDGGQISGQGAHVRHAVKP